MSSLSLTFFTALSRVSSVPLSSSLNLNLNVPPPFSLSFQSGPRRFASFKLKAMSKMLQDVESTQKAIVATSSAQDKDKKSSSGEVNHSHTFLDVRTEQGQFLLLLFPLVVSFT